MTEKFDYGGLPTYNQAGKEDFQKAKCDLIHGPSGKLL